MRASSLWVALLAPAMLVFGSLAPATAERVEGLSPPISLDLSREIVSEVDTPHKSGLQNPHAVAVIIGNKNYRGKDVPAVEFAVRDAQAVRMHLVDTLGYREENILFEVDATKAVFERTFGTAQDHKGRLFDLVREGESDVFVYYSGHGAPEARTGGRGFFVPVDADPNYVRLEGYPLDQLYRNLEKLPARSLTVVIDACFSGGSDAGMLLKGMSPVGITIENPLLLKKNTAVFTAATGSQVSSWYKEKGHGLFTYYFLLGLRGEAERHKKYGKVTLEEMQEYLTKEVKHWARRLYGRQQTPQTQGPADLIVVPGHRSP